MNDVTQDLLAAISSLEEAARCVQSGEWDRDSLDTERRKARAAIARAEAALADAKNDSYRLDALEAVAKASRTGVSFDWCRYVEDGIVVEHGYRMMWKHAIGPREKSVRHAIDAAMEVFKP